MAAADAVYAAQVFLVVGGVGAHEMRGLSGSKGRRGQVGKMARVGKSRCTSLISSD